MAHKTVLLNSGKRTLTLSMLTTGMSSLPGSWLSSRTYTTRAVPSSIFTCATTDYVQRRAGEDGKINITRECKGGGIGRRGVRKRGVKFALCLPAKMAGVLSSMLCCALLYCRSAVVVKK